MSAAGANNSQMPLPVRWRTGSVGHADRVGVYGCTETNPDRPTDFERRRAPPAIVEEDRAPGVRIGCDPSTAYATDEILVVLLLQAGVGSVAFGVLVPIAIVVCVLMAIVVTSYRQTIMAYPSGGGAYIVSRENLGTTPSLVAGAALLVDYILTVSVSVAGGVLAIRTATGFGTNWTVPVCLLCVGVITVMNLRA